MARRAEHHFLSGFASTKPIPRDQTWHHIFSAGPALEAKSSMKSDPQVREVASHCSSSAMFDTNMRYLAVSRRSILDYGFGAEIEPTAVIGRSHYDLFPDRPGYWRDVH